MFSILGYAKSLSGKFGESIKMVLDTSNMMSASSAVALRT